MIEVLGRYSFADRSVAQFCCNNGRELLSLAHSRKTSVCVGFDIAENQVGFAGERAKELGIDCRFVATDILAIGAEYHDAFEYALMTVGALCWFEDLDLLFRTVSACLNQNGVLFINEQHPVCDMLGLPGDEGYDEQNPTKLVHPYFGKEWVGNDGMYYMTGKRYASETFIDYSHPFGAIMNALIRNGLTVTAFDEYDYDISDGFGQLDRRGIPLSYILVCEKRG